MDKGTGAISGAAPITSCPHLPLNQQVPVRTTPPPPAQTRACPGTEWALNRCFYNVIGPLFFCGLEFRMGRL